MFDSDRLLFIFCFDIDGDEKPRGFKTRENRTQVIHLSGETAFLFSIVLYKSSVSIDKELFAENLIIPHSIHFICYSRHRMIPRYHSPC